MESATESSGSQAASSNATDSEHDDGLWSSRVTRDIGRQVRRWRRRHKITIQQLSDLTASIGQRVPPTVLTNLEHRRRDFVSVSELLLIAAALNVPPVLLIAPIGHQSEMEVLPNVRSSPWRTRGWLMGAIPPAFADFNLERWNDATAAIKLYDTHRLLVRSYQESLHRLKELDDDRMDVYPGRQWPQEALEQRRRLRRALLSQVAAYLERIRSHRREIEALGFLLPALAPEVEADLTAPVDPPEADLA